MDVHDGRLGIGREVQGGQSVETVQGFRAGVVEAGDGEHEGACDEGCDGGCKECEGKEAVDRCLGSARPDPVCTRCGDCEERRNDVDDKAPFFVRLQAVQGDESDVRE